MGYNSRQSLKTALLMTNPSFKIGVNCDFNATGSITRPFTSALQSYVPISETTICANFN